MCERVKLQGTPWTTVVQSRAGKAPRGQIPGGQWKKVQLSVENSEWNRQRVFDGMTCFGSGLFSLMPLPPDIFSKRAWHSHLSNLKASILFDNLPEISHAFYFSIYLSTFSLRFYWNLYFLFTSLSFYWNFLFTLLFYLQLYFLFTFPFAFLLSLYFSIEMPTFSLLFYWNLYFFQFSIEISTIPLLFYWNLYFLFTFLFASLLSLYFSNEVSTFFYFCIEISTFSLLFYWNLYFSLTFCWNLYFLFAFLVKSLFSLYFSIEISTFFFYWDLYPHAPLHRICTSITLRKAIMPCFPQCNYAHKNFKEKLCPESDGSRARPAPQPRRDRAAHQWWVTSWLLHHLTLLFNGELPLDYSTTWLSYPIFRNYGSF